MPHLLVRRASSIGGMACLALACSESPGSQIAPPSLGQSGAGGGEQAKAGSSSGFAGGAGGGGGPSSSGAGGALAFTGGDAGRTGVAGTAGATGTRQSPFPGGVVAAVSLTYDDGLDSHLAIVQPALEAVGFRGTFFLSSFEGVDHDWALPSVKMPLLPLSPRHLAWQAAGQKGHELADHTVNHPCNSDSKTPGFHYTDYTMARMQQELDESLARLARLGVVSPITFAYPCAGDKAGVGQAGEDFSPLVAERFVAARVSSSGIADPSQVDLLRVSQLDTGGKSGDELKKLVDDVIAAKGWLVLLFHGVGKEQASCPQNLGYAPEQCMINYLTTSAESHAALVQYLAEKQSQVWTAPFKQVAAAIATHRAK